MHVARVRVTVVITCVCVCVCVCVSVVFCHHVHLNPEIKIIGTYVFTATRKNFYNRDFR